MNFKLIKEFRYSGEGWGLTQRRHKSDHERRHARHSVYRSGNFRDDSHDRRQRRKRQTFDEIKRARIRQRRNLGEHLAFGRAGIECKPNHIARIDPADGKILGWIDFGGISPDDDGARDSENTLNGIAYDAAADRIFVTGKKWKKLFEIKVKPKQ